MAKREYILDYTAEEINEGIGKALTRDNLSDFMDDSEHRLVTDEEKSSWDSKQDVLTFDDNPTPDSDNPVKSSGINRQLGNVFNSLNSLINSQVEGLRGQMSGMYNSLDNSKQDKFTVGDGLELVNNTLNVVLDTDIFVIVQSLPTTDISDNKIYLVPSTTQGQDNIYTEYVHKNGAWEKIGEYKADIDLTPYLTKNEASSTYATKAQIPTVPTKVSAFENDSNYLVDQGDGRYGCIIYGNGSEYENTMIKNSLHGYTTINVNPVGIDIDTTNTTEGGGDVVVTTPSEKGLIVNGKYVITEHQDISGKADISSLATVATTGSYNDLSDKPTIPTVPTNVSVFTNDANYLVGYASGVIYGNSTNLVTKLQNSSGAQVYIEMNPLGININTANSFSGGFVSITTPASGGLAINNKLVQTKTSIVVSNETTLNVENNTYYRFDNEVNTLNIVLPTINRTLNIESLILNFTTGTTPAVTISSSDNKTIAYFDGYSIVANTTYELNIMYNGSKWIVAYGIIG